MPEAYDTRGLRREAERDEALLDDITGRRMISSWTTAKIENKGTKREL